MVRTAACSGRIGGGVVVCAHPLPCIRPAAGAHCRRCLRASAEVARARGVHGGDRRDLHALRGLGLFAVLDPGPAPAGSERLEGAAVLVISALVALAFADLAIPALFFRWRRESAGRVSSESRSGTGATATFRYHVGGRGPTSRARNARHRRRGLSSQRGALGSLVYREGPVDGCGKSLYVRKRLAMPIVFPTPQPYRPYPIAQFAH